MLLGPCICISTWADGGHAVVIEDGDHVSDDAGSAHSSSRAARMDECNLSRSDSEILTLVTDFSGLETPSMALGERDNDTDNMIWALGDLARGSL